MSSWSFGDFLLPNLVLVAYIVSLVLTAKWWWHDG